MIELGATASRIFENSSQFTFFVGRLLLRVKWCRGCTSGGCTGTVSWSWSRGATLWSLSGSGLRWGSVLCGHLVRWTLSSFYRHLDCCSLLLTFKPTAAGWDGPGRNKKGSNSMYVEPVKKLLNSANIIEPVKKLLNSANAYLIHNLCSKIFDI